MESEEVKKAREIIAKYEQERAMSAKQELDAFLIQWGQKWGTKLDPQISIAFNK